MVTAEEIIENFELLGDWEERYSYIIDLGKKLPPMPEEEKCDDNRVEGCVSNVWMVGGFSDDAPALLTMRLDSDAIIVKGLLSLMLILYEGRTREQVLELDVDGLFAKLGLMEHLSPTRQNGLHSMVATIQNLAKG